MLIVESGSEIDKFESYCKGE